MSRARALLIIDHGSRRAGANRLVELVAERVRARRPEFIVEHAHMEIAEPSLAEAVARCVAAGASEIVVHPYFLTSGRHTSETIPELVATTAREHPDVKIRISKPLGLHDKLIEVVLERLDEQFDDG